MKFKIKDPGSAITHFIGCVRKYIHDRNERVYPEHDPSLCGKYHLPYGGFYGKGKPTSEKNGSYDDLYIDCRKLYSGLSDHSGRTDGICPLCCSMGGGPYRYYRESLLDHLSQMVFFSDLYRYGLAVCIRLCAYCESFLTGRFRLASGRRSDLYHWRRDLCPEASDF